MLVLSGVASAINYIQSLAGDPGVRLFISDCDPYCPGLYVPGVIPVPLPPARAGGAYRSALAEAIERHGIEALIPTSDYDVEAVIQWVEEGWRPPVKLFSPPFEAYGRLGDKGRLARHLSDKFPKNLPRSFGADSDPGSLPYPVVVKPSNMSGGKGVAICRTREDFLSARARLRQAYGQALLVQEYIPGGTYVLTMVYGHGGELVAAVGMRSRLTFFTWGGGGIAGEVVDEPGLAELAQAMVAESGGWRGPINLEFKRHESTERFMLMEANCRLNGYSYLTTMNGINLPRIVLETLLGWPTSQPAPPSEAERCNFLIGYRETPVDGFLA
nr:ATP-grasp domain-containing protein [Fundidesulfovibrio agrisoli]